MVSDFTVVVERLRSLFDKVELIHNEIKDTLTELDKINDLNTEGVIVIKTTKDKDSEEKININETLRTKFIGPNSLFVKYLHPSVIDGGCGKLEPGFYNLKQYHEDIFAIGIKRLKEWDSGFYRNKDTRETQLLIHVNIGHACTIIVDGLPNNEIVFKVYFHMNDIGDNEMTSVPHDVEDISDARLLKVYDALEDYLMNKK